MPSVTYLFTKLVNIGAFPVSKPPSLSQPSFFLSTLSTIRRRLSQGDNATASYSMFWSAVLESLPSLLTLQNVLSSLFAHISVPDTPLDVSAPSRGLVKREATLLQGIVGRLGKDTKYILDSTSAVVLARNWSEGHARVYVCWAAGASTGVVNYQGKSLSVVTGVCLTMRSVAISAFLTSTLDMWTSPEHIKYSLLGRHHCKAFEVLHTIP
jgi:telomere length regulation protein